MLKLASKYILSIFHLILISREGALHA
ncbi:hypothetical protein EG68_06500 [Paragonimus skrjabini miyazakii]|uniref:Uncharacterized protein n=1 Tax=Paragonimus skrjabini miyazakii TaxID=59628 RepID=A0A8S9YP59_9TREM|nr:hypothetical protein EG68_06500 [Paragonimus skrjabini miyazakii]